MQILPSMIVSGSQLTFSSTTEEIINWLTVRPFIPTVLEALQSDTNLYFAINGQLIWINVGLDQQISLESTGLVANGQRFHFRHHELDLNVQSANTNGSQARRSVKVKAEICSTIKPLGASLKDTIPEVANLSSYQLIFKGVRLPDDGVLGNLNVKIGLLLQLAGPTKERLFRFSSRSSLWRSRTRRRCHPRILWNT